MITRIKFRSTWQAIGFHMSSNIVGAYHITLHDNAEITFGHRLTNEDISHAIESGALSIDVRPGESICAVIAVDEIQSKDMVKAQ